MKKRMWMTALGAAMMVLPGCGGGGDGDGGNVSELSMPNFAAQSQEVLPVVKSEPTVASLAVDFGQGQEAWNDESDPGKFWIREMVQSVFEGGSPEVGTESIFGILGNMQRMVDNLPFTESCVPGAVDLENGTFMPMEGATGAPVEGAIDIPVLGASDVSYDCIATIPAMEVGDQGTSGTVSHSYAYTLDGKHLAYVGVVDFGTPEFMAFEGVYDETTKDLVADFYQYSNDSDLFVVRTQFSGNVEGHNFEFKSTHRGPDGTDDEKYMIAKGVSQGESSNYLIRFERPSETDSVPLADGSTISGPFDFCLDAADNAFAADATGCDEYTSYIDVSDPMQAYIPLEQVPALPPADPANWIITQQ